MNRTLVLLAAVLAMTAAQAEWQSIGPDGGYIQAFGVDPQDASVQYALPYEYPENARVFRSTDAGASWVEAGRLPSQTSSFLIIDRHHDSLVYAGARTNELCRSTDRGATWSLVTLPGNAVRLVSDPLVPGRLYLAGYYSYGGAFRQAAFISTDYGLTWSYSMPQPESTSYAYAVAVDPTSSGTVYLGGYRAQVHKSTDAGASWVMCNSGITAGASIQWLSVNGSDSDILLAATSAGMFRSTDAGVSWGPVGASMTMAMGAEFSDPDPDIAYAVGVDASRVYGIYVSTDAGATWTLPTPGYVTTKGANLVLDPEDAATAYVSSTAGIHRSTDRAANWHEAHTGLRIAGVSCINASPDDPRRLYLELDAVSVYWTSTGGDTWAQCNEFLSCGNICQIGVGSATDRDVLYALEGSG